MKQIAKLSLFLLHVTGVLLCLSCTVVTIDRVVTLIPRYTLLGGWLSHLEADSTHVLWLTTWSLGLAAVPAMGLFCLDQPAQRRRRKRRPTMPRLAKARQPNLASAWKEDDQELVFAWVDDGGGSSEAS